MKKSMMAMGIFLCGLIFGFAPVFAWPVPDTGQITCYDDEGNEIIPCPSPGQPFYGQDANYRINSPSYTKLDAGGNPLSLSAPSWAMVRDNVTGLIWEVKQNKDGVKDYENPHDADNTYTWYDPSDPDDQGTPGDGRDTDDFIHALNSVHYGGYSDWRLPTIKELAYLVDYSMPYPGPTINTTCFPNTWSSYYFYWSSTTDADSTQNAWGVRFHYGYDGSSSKSNRHYVRAVRGVQSSNTFVNNGNGTVTDTSTGLMWEVKTDDGSIHDKDNTYTWQEALAYCEELDLGGHTDWRLPTTKELRSLLDYSQYSPAINETFFPNTVSSDYWSSTTHDSYPGYGWYIDFGSGDDGWILKTEYHHVQGVRVGQFGTLLHVDPGGTCDGNERCYRTIQAALNSASDGDVIRVRQGSYTEAPAWNTAGTVSISGGWNSTFTLQTGTTEMYAPNVGGGGGVKVMPRVRVIPD